MSGTLYQDLTLVTDLVNLALENKPLEILECYKFTTTLDAVLERSRKMQI